MSILFLFGAGASYGSDVQRTPPLGAALFNALRSFNPDGWGSIQGGLADTFRRDFEEGMKTVPGTALAPLQRAMAAYFFDFVPQSANLYFEIAKRISPNWAGAFCTLNYERLLELSLIGAGIQPFIGSAPSDKRSIELCLPHGCCHLFCDSVQGMSGHVMFQGFQVQTNGPVNVVSDAQKHRSRVLQDAFPPVMSFFEPSKRTTSGNSFVEGQRARWQALAVSANTLIVVGVRVRQHDGHIWGPIAASGARVVYCAGVDAGTEYEAWARTARSGRRDRVLRGYFREEFHNICAEAGI